MNATLRTMMSLLVLSAPTPVAAQLESEQLEGNQRICIYRDDREKETVERRVGLGQPCPAFPKAQVSSLRAPPTARLESERLRNGQRVCEYAQLGRVWVVTLASSEHCPLSAGMIQTGE